MLTVRCMRTTVRASFLILAFCFRLAAAEKEALPADPYFAPFKPLKAPVPTGLVLKRGDRLAICGDSITEQKMYSRAVETYLTVCVPELEVTVRQYGWSGETAPGFLSRMTNDALRFHPTVATTCYGMNDHRYRPYLDEIGRAYRANSQAILRAFKENGVRVIHGSPGTVGKMPSWVKSAEGTVNDLNLNLLELRNVGVELAAQEQTGFADVFLPMLVEGFHAQQQYGADFMITGKDGVHPGWAGQMVMATAFLKAMGLDGDLGAIIVDFAAMKAEASGGHRIVSCANGAAEIESSRYPFCATGELNSDGSVRAGMALVHFDESLNRLVLRVRGAPAKSRVTWGASTRSYASADLEKGINLAADFATNPFTEAFNRVDDAVGKKQAYETRQIKDLFHGPEGRADMEATVALSEKVRAPLAEAIRTAFKPVRHTLKIEAE